MYDAREDATAVEVASHTTAGGLQEPTEDEWTTLRKVSGKVPMIAYTLCLVEFAERASYYGCQNVFSNFMQFPLPEGGNGGMSTFSAFVSLLSMPRSSEDMPKAI